MKCVTHDYVGGNLKSNGFYNGSLGFPWSNVWNMYRRNPVQRQRSASPSHFSVRTFPYIPHIYLFFLAPCKQFVEYAYLFNASGSPAT